MKEIIQEVLNLKKENLENDLVDYLTNLSSAELKEVYTLYYYAKEIEIENYDITFLEFQEKYDDTGEEEMIMELSYGKTLHALNHYLENIEEKIEKHEEEIERRRTKKEME